MMMMMTSMMPDLLPLSMIVVAVVSDVLELLVQFEVCYFGSNHCTKDDTDADDAVAAPWDRHCSIAEAIL